MIAMQMADQDGAQRVGIDAELADGDHRGRAAIHEKSTHPVAHMEAGVEAATAAKGIARPKKLHLHRKSPSSSPGASRTIILPHRPMARCRNNPSFTCGG